LHTAVNLFPYTYARMQLKLNRNCGFECVAEVVGVCQAPLHFPCRLRSAGSAGTCMHCMPSNGSVKANVNLRRVNILPSVLACRIRTVFFDKRSNKVLDSIGTSGCTIAVDALLPLILSGQGARLAGWLHRRHAARAPPQCNASIRRTLDARLPTHIGLYM
jgi:hypothetical protein